MSAVYYNEFGPKAAQWLRNLIAAGEIPPGTVDERDIREVQAHELTGFDQCHFFAGVAGWPLALRLAGWGDRPVWSGSCPCQPFSVAGKRKGAADERHLWPAWFRLIRECRPATIVGEQVASKAALEWLDGVFDDLEGAGYACGATDLCAASVGAPHIRQRLYWMAESDSTRRAEAMRRERFAQRDEPEPGRCSMAGRMAHSPSGGLGADGSAPRKSGHTDERGADGGVGESDGVGQEGWAAIGTWTNGPVPSSENSWSNYQLVWCRDGKYRRVGSGIFPLVAGLPRVVGPGFAGLDRVGIRAARANRVIRLKGYGNAIVVPLAVEFVKAVTELIG